jgi:hypothetical protein
MSIMFWIPFFFAPQHNNTCSLRGEPLIEITQGSDTDSKRSTTKIFESGGWKAGTERGCFDKKELRAIRQAVQRAPWKETSSPIACFAYDPNFTEYRVHGELRFTERMCSGKQADAKTMRAIELIKQELADEVMPAPLPPPPPPPVATCSAQGTPLFEIRYVSELEQPSRSTAIYANGAWTQNGKSGCLSKQTIGSLRDVIKQSPWETTTKQFTCRAYSPNWTEYYVNGVREYTARMCGAESLDEKSLGAIKIIEDELKNL